MYAHKLTRRSGPSARREVEDLAAEALIYALENLAGQPTRRHWDRRRVDLAGFCMGVIKSRLSADRNWSSRNALIDIASVEEELSYSAPQERSMEVLNALESLEASLRDDSVASHVFRYQCMDPDMSVMEMAHSLKVSVKSIIAARRRIQRRAQTLLGTDKID